MTHVIGTNSRDSVETPLLDCNQDAKVSLEEQDLSITLPGPSPTGKHYNIPSKHPPQITPLFLPGQSWHSYSACSRHLWPRQKRNPHPESG
jgi:hypothetical protein